MRIAAADRRSRPRLRALPALALGAVVVLAGPAAAQSTADSKPYDDRLLRLSEILGAVHYLRELCASNDGQLWRERMREILDAEGSTPLRRARLTRSFNNGYNSYGRTYKFCTPSAQTTITRFMAEGAQIADTLVRTIP